MRPNGGVHCPCRVSRGVPPSQHQLGGFPHPPRVGFTSPRLSAQAGEPQQCVKGTPSPPFGLPPMTCTEWGATSHHPQGTGYQVRTRHPLLARPPFAPGANRGAQGGLRRCAPACPGAPPSRAQAQPRRDSGLNCANPIPGRVELLHPPLPHPLPSAQHAGRTTRPLCPGLCHPHLPLLRASQARRRVGPLLPNYATPCRATCPLLLAPARAPACARCMQHGQGIVATATVRGEAGRVTTAQEGGVQACWHAA